MRKSLRRSESRSLQRRSKCIARECGFLKSTRARRRRSGKAMNTTVEVVTDLWPLYAAGEASADTRELVDEFLAQHPDFARRLRDDTSAEILKPAAMTLPPDHEMTTLLKTQRRRAVQSMLVNSVALLISGLMTTLFFWKVVPAWDRMLY